MFYGSRSKQLFSCADLDNNWSEAHGTICVSNGLNIEKELDEDLRTGGMANNKAANELRQNDRRHICSESAGEDNIHF